MKFTALTHFERNARRVTEIVGVLGKYGLADWLGGLNYEWLQGRLVSFDGERLGKLSREARIRLALTELGTTFIKLGQMLSTRGDVIGPELAVELGQLRSNTPPDPPDVVRKTIETEFGATLEDLFQTFETNVLASASIGQVHRARLHDDQDVVVKVQHAGIETTIASDLDIMAGLAEVLQNHVQEVRNYQPIALARDFRRILLQELDFSTERRNLIEFTRNFARDPNIHFPRVFPALCSRRVLTMELLPGVSFEDADALRSSGFDLNELTSRGANMYLEMIFRDGFYHADPHPGNLMLLPGGVVGVMDCGMVGRIDEAVREDIENILLGIIQRDANEVAEVVMRLGDVPAELDREALRGELSSYVMDYGNRSLADFNLSEALNRMMDIIRRYQIHLPPSCALLLKTLVMLEGTSQQLNPTFSLAELMRPYEVKSLRRRFSVKRGMRRMYKTYRDWDRLLEVVPRDLADILRRVRTGHFEVHHVHRRLETTVNRLVLGILTAALFVGSAGLWAQHAQPELLNVSVPGSVGCIVAIAMGLWIFCAIRRSRNDDQT